jgi:hypothetical protein
MTIDGFSRGHERRTLIFDPATAVLLEEEDVLLDKVDWLDADPPARCRVRHLSRVGDRTDDSVGGSGTHDAQVNGRRLDPRRH